MTTRQPSIDRIVVATCGGSHSWIIEDRGDYCPSCGLAWKRTRYTTRDQVRREAEAQPVPFQVQTFKPYEEEGFTGEGIRIETKGQREALCAKHDLSYDPIGSPTPPKIAPAIDSLSVEDVKGIMHNPNFLAEHDTEPHLPDAPPETNPDE